METSSAPVRFNVRWRWAPFPRPYGEWSVECWCGRTISAQDLFEFNRILIDHVRTYHRDDWDPAQPVYATMGDLEQFKKYADLKVNVRWGVT